MSFILENGILVGIIIVLVAVVVLLEWSLVILLRLKTASVKGAAARAAEPIETAAPLYVSSKTAKKTAQAIMAVTPTKVVGQPRMDSLKLKCPGCNSDHLWKNGATKRTQRWRCCDCHKMFNTAKEVA